MTDVERIMRSMEGLAKSIEALDGRLTKSLEAVEGRIKGLEDFEKAPSSLGSRMSVTFKREAGQPEHEGGGGEAADDGEGFENGEDFQFERRHSRRFSTGSAAGAKDAGTKIERPKFVVKKYRMIEGVKEENLQDSDVLDYLDAYDHFFATWKTVPANEGLEYTNEDRVPIVTLPPTYAKKICRRIKWVFDTSELAFGTVAQAQSAKFWRDITSKGLRKAIGLLVEKETSHKGALDSLKRVTFKSAYGPIDMEAFTTYQHEFKKEILRLQSGGRTMDSIQLKNIIISAFPDREYQKELIAQFGSDGVLIGDREDFAINVLFDVIEGHIERITKEGVRSIVNKHARARDASIASSFSPRTPSHGSARFTGKAVHSVEMPELFGESAASNVEQEYTEGTEDIVEFPVKPEDDDDLAMESWQVQVNSAVANNQKCSRPGKGPDGLLLCKFLGGSEAKCIFSHPEEDNKLKGRGFSSARPFAPTKL
jgi:hypothetical protein